MATDGSASFRKERLDVTLFQKMIVALSLNALCAEEFRLPLCALAPDNRGKLEALSQEYALEYRGAVEGA